MAVSGHSGTLLPHGTFEQPYATFLFRSAAQAAFGGRRIAPGTHGQRRRNRMQPASGHRILQRHLAGEMPIEVGVAHPKPARHVHHIGLGRAVAAEQFLRRVQDPVACRFVGQLAVRSLSNDAMPWAG